MCNRHAKVGSHQAEEQKEWNKKSLSSKTQTACCTAPDRIRIDRNGDWPMVHDLDHHGLLRRAVREAADVAVVLREEALRP